ncbi:cytochrome P450 [Marmoricola sp. OAE513]|uniref:cytochrome P450 n=1 Tax=Marmoricola sp. OAE513 TaxID=2817894 RepID=UPI001AE1CE0F
MSALSYDPLDVDFLADPYPAFAWLRENDPVHHHPKDDRAPAFWALSRFEHIWEAVRRPDLFSSAQGLTFFPDEIGQLGIPPTMVMLDPPVQTQLRSLIGRGFTPKRVTVLEDRIRDFVRARLDDMGRRWRDGMGVDLHEHFSSTIPTYVLAELFGIPLGDQEKFAPWVNALTQLQNDGFSLDPNGSATGAGALTAMAEMMEYFTAAIAHRRQNPTDDLLGALVAAEVTDENGTHRLSDWDILGFCFVVVAGGSDTTASLITHAVTLLGDAPEQRRLLLEDPSLISGSLIEFLRLESSVQGLARTTTAEVTIDGTTIPAGEKVMMLYAAGNRDPREFGETADALDVRREITRHLAFSSGPHFCIGTHLARLQARVALEELLARHPQVAVDAAAGTRHQSAFVRGWLSIPVTSL